MLGFKSVFSGLMGLATAFGAVALILAAIPAILVPWMKRGAAE